MDDQGRASGRRSVVVVLRRFGGALLHGFLLILQGALRATVWCFVAMALLALTVGVGVYLVPVTMRMVSGLTFFGRLEALHWSGTAIEPAPRRQRRPFSLRPGVAWRETVDVLADPVAWRDLAWLTSATLVGFVTGVAVIGFVGVPFAFGVVLPLIWWFGGTIPAVGSAGDAAGWILFSAGLFCLGVWLAPRLVALYTLLARSLLAPPRSALLTARVEQLRRTRADTVDTQALEMRRIERDLHDGAQSRLVTLALTLGEMERMLDPDGPDVDKARETLALARSGSVQALQELRDLVRGIHPPVLADRGLADAVQALALDSPMAVHVSARLPGRPHPAVETAVYFAVTELLTNAVRHGEARRAHVVLEALGAVERALRVTVVDDGCGGADPALGSGLDGVERRMAAFDGRMVLVSPEGGPTMVTLEVPDAWPERLAGR